MLAFNAFSVSALNRNEDPDASGLENKPCSVFRLTYSSEATHSHSLVLGTQI